MFDIDSDDILSKEIHYEFQRSDGTMSIVVLQSISGGDFKFLAIPRLSQGEGEREFWGKGETEIDALKHCLALIKNVSIKDVFPTLRNG